MGKRRNELINIKHRDLVEQYLKLEERFNDLQAHFEDKVKDGIHYYEKYQEAARANWDQIETIKGLTKERDVALSEKAEMLKEVEEKNNIIKIQSMNNRVLLEEIMRLRAGNKNGK